jgi:hypothetical protein
MTQLSGGNHARSAAFPAQLTYVPTRAVLDGSHKLPDVQKQ